MCDLPLPCRQLSPTSNRIWTQFNIGRMSMTHRINQLRVLNLGRTVAIVVLLGAISGCGSAKQLKALQNSTFAYDSSETITLGIREEASLDGYLVLYRELAEKTGTRTFAERLDSLLQGAPFSLTLDGIGDRGFKKTYRNPFDIVPEASEPQMTLSISIGSFYVNEAAFDGGDQLKRAAISAVLPVSQLKEDANFITLTCELTDRSIGRVVYRFDVEVREGSALMTRGSFGWIMDRTFQKLLDKLLES
jgi:hypothetical protein